MSEVTTATIATTPKSTAPTTFRSISGFALPSMYRNNSPLLQVSYFWNFRHRRVRYYWYSLIAILSAVTLVSKSQALFYRRAIHILKIKARTTTIIACMRMASDSFQCSSDMYILGYSSVFACFPCSPGRQPLRIWLSCCRFVSGGTVENAFFCMCLVLQFAHHASTYFHKQ